MIDSPNPLDCYQQAHQNVNAGSYMLLSCPNPSPGQSVTLNLNIAVLEGYHMWTTYFYLVLDDVNYVWIRGGTPDCLNADCTTKSKPGNREIYTSWSFQSDHATKAYYFIIQDNNFAGTPTYALTVAPSDPAGVYALRNSAWDKFSDYPYECSLNFWSPTTVVTEQWGTMNQINGGTVEYYVLIPTFHSGSLLISRARYGLLGSPMQVRSKTSNGPNCQTAPTLASTVSFVQQSRFVN
jgi:hypothetical protein